MTTDPQDSIAIQAFKPYEQFCKALLDGYCVVDQKGKVLKCNPLFSQIIGLKTKPILKAESLDEIFTMSVAGKDLKISDILTHSAPTRIDEVSGKSSERDGLNLILGVFPLVEAGVTIGAFLLVRDVTAEANLQGKYTDKATQSVTDALTGLFNRTYFNDYLKNQVKVLESFPADAPQRLISVIMLDIDFFKKINDKYGHQAGDFVLQHTADLMKKNFRKTDVVARYGGEEFLAILPGTDLLGAAVASEKLRESIEKYVYDFNGTVIPVTMSSGVAQITVGSETGEQAIARADQALYFSKQSGRNRVSIHDGHAVAAPKLD